MWNKKSANGPNTSATIEGLLNMIVDSEDDDTINELKRDLHRGSLY